MSVDPLPSTSEMAAASTFSYAQAAKGQPGNNLPTSETTPASKAESSTSAAPTEKSIDTQASTAETSQAASMTEAHTSVNEKQEADNVSANDTDSRTESVQEKRTENKRDDETSRLDRPWRRNEKSTRSSSAATRSVDEQESRRPRKGKKGKNADKQSSDNSNSGDKKDEPEAPKIELADAAIPSVNIWQQRREAQAAHVPSKPNSEGPTDIGTTHTPAASSVPNAVSTNGVKPARISEKPERNASRGNRVAAREAKAEAPPPTNDAISWPTPETAVHQDEKKPAEKPVEKPAQDDGAAKPRQKKEWQTYDFVPSVTFETQLPQMRSSKPRGGAKGASSTRPTASAPGGEKGATSTPPKASETRERVPRDTPNGAPRNNSLPPTSKRASMDVANARGEQRRAAQGNAPEKSKDSAPSHMEQQQPREARSERGRGGFRGRGGTHGVNSHGQHANNAASTSAAPYAVNGAPPTRSQGPYSPPPRGGHGGQMYMPPPRGGRGARAGGYNSHRMSLPNGGSSRLPPLHTQPGPYDYQQMQGPMTAVPYQQPYWENNGWLTVVRHQIEYYFSVENLCKDLFLRKHMDSQGFVPLMFVTGFSRMKAMSPEMAHVRMACEESDVLDYIVAEDDTERLRRRDGWEKFVLPVADREPGARNDGPSRIMWKSRSYNYQPQYSGMMAPYGVASPPPYAGQVPYPDPKQGMNGMANGHGGSVQLSADVPDFSPSHAAGEAPQLPNGHAQAPMVNGDAAGQS